jgi:hypothetical protein
MFFYIFIFIFSILHLKEITRYFYFWIEYLELDLGLFQPSIQINNIVDLRPTGDILAHQNEIYLITIYRQSQRF